MQDHNQAADSAASPQPSKVIDVVSPPASSGGTNQSAPDPELMGEPTVEPAPAPAPEPQEDTVTPSPDQAPAEAVKQPAESPAKVPSTVPIGAIITAVIIFLVLAAAALMAYNRGY